jgi:divinyl protochlorophyllide a 8-vinyl-reductase
MAAGCPEWVADPPGAMIDESRAAAIFRALERALPGEAAAIEAEAGRLTAAYVLANRIPAPARAVLKALPARLAGPMLLKAIAKHAWTFAGSGAFRVVEGGAFARAWRVEIAGNPLAGAPCGCVWHAAVFTGLFRALVSPGATARETGCAAHGAPACRFEISP